MMAGFILGAFMAASGVLFLTLAIRDIANDTIGALCIGFGLLGGGCYGMLVSLGWIAPL